MNDIDVGDVGHRKPRHSSRMQWWWTSCHLAYEAFAVLEPPRTFSVGLESACVALCVTVNRDAFL